MSRTHSSLREALPADHACGCKPGRACDGLECLCRPRFFAGQLLTDEDLRRLDHYVVAKNRLHNRYLHGTGVVCGLEVVCSPCDDTVTVRSGYAIGPCGEDIVLCRDTAVDVGELILDHRRKQATSECEPYGARPAQDCEAARQRWILAVCYDEWPSRGVTSLRQPAHSGCGCGSGARVDAGTCSPSRPRPQPPQCEPTVTCEGWRFVLLKERPRPVPDQPGRSPTTVGPAPAAGGLAAAGGGLAGSELGQRVQLCLLEITARMDDLSQAGGSTTALVELCCDLKEQLRDVIETGNVHDCMIGARLSEVLCPDPNAENAGERAKAAIQQLLVIAIDLYKSCVCSALLPPCGVGSPDDCIPIATLTVRTADLRVLEICNWSSRRFAVNFPMLGYWLGWLPIFDELRATVSRLCCAPTRPRFQVEDSLRVTAFGGAGPRATDADAAAPPRPAPGREEASAMRPDAFTELAGHYLREANPLSGLEATVLAALGVRAEDGSELATALELQNPLAALALSRLTALVPDAARGAVSQLLETGVPPGAEAAAEAERVERLETAVAALQRTVRSQASTIGKLRKRIDER